MPRTRRALRSASRLSAESVPETEDDHDGSDSAHEMGMRLSYASRKAHAGTQPRSIVVSTSMLEREHFKNPPIP